MKVERNRTSYDDNKRSNCRTICDNDNLSINIFLPGNIKECRLSLGMDHPDNDLNDADIKISIDVEFSPAETLRIYEKLHKVFGD